MKTIKQKSTVDYLREWTKPYHKAFIFSVVCAIIGVAGALVSYIGAANVITLLLNETKSIEPFISSFIIIVVGFIINQIFHNCRVRKKLCLFI